MYGPDRFGAPLSRPLPMYIPRPSTVSSNKMGHSSRVELDDFSYRPELPQTSSTYNSGESRNDLLTSSEARELSSCFTSYVVPTVPSPSLSSFMPRGMVAPEVPWFETESCGTHIEYEGTKDEDRKKEREHKKRSKNWTRPETLKLIRARSDIDSKFGRTGRKAELWDEIAATLHRENFSRDAQQCKDKWEKLSAGYKEVRDSIRLKEDFPYFDELDRLLSGRSKRRDRESDFVAMKDKQDTDEMDDLEPDISGDLEFKEDSPSFFVANIDGPGEAVADHEAEGHIQGRKRKKCVKFVSVTDLSAVQELMETLLERQQIFFNDLLDAVEKREQVKEQLRQEREDKWRAEEREQRRVLNSAMLVLTQKLLGECSGTGIPTVTRSSENLADEHMGLKRGSKNWKRSEVLQLIRLRKDMESKVFTSTCEGALWGEIAEVLGAQGVQRDAKQCREKWDKLMTELKDVLDGRRDQSESPYFLELKSFVDEGHCNT